MNLLRDSFVFLPVVFFVIAVLAIDIYFDKTTLFPQKQTCNND